MELCIRCEWREPVWGRRTCPRCLYFSRKYAKQYFADSVHAESRKTDVTNWVNRNPDRKREIARNWGRNNKEKVLAAGRLWSKLNPEKNVAKRNRRRAILMKLNSHYLPEEWQEVLIKFDNLCAHCAKPEKLTVDHVIPLSRGGSNTIDNIQPLCRSCNSRKGVSL